MQINKGLALRGAIIVALLALLYAGGTPLEAIAVLALFFAIVVLFRQWFYVRVEKYLVKQLPFLATLHPWTRQAVVIGAFFVIYLIVKTVAFALLAVAGFDVQQYLLNAVNASASNASR